MAQIFDWKGMSLSMKFGVTLLIAFFFAGVLPIMASFVAYEDQWRGLPYYMFGSLLVGGVLAFVVSHLLVKKGIITKIEALSSWTNKVHRGHYEDPPGLDEGDEIGTLAREFKEVYEDLVEELKHSKILLVNLTDTVQNINSYSGEILSISNEQATGANEQAEKAYMFGLDEVRLIPVE